MASKNTTTKNGGRKNGTNGNGNGHGGRKAIGQLLDSSVDYARAVRARKVARFTPEQKRAAVRAFLAGEKTSTELALKIGTYPGVISRWAMDARFGGVAGGRSGRGVAANVPQPATNGRKKVARKKVGRKVARKSPAK